MWLCPGELQVLDAFIRECITEIAFYTGIGRCRDDQICLIECSCDFITCGLNTLIKGFNVEMRIVL